jgi:adenylate cyclase
MQPGNIFDAFSATTLTASLDKALYLPVISLPARHRRAPFIFAMKLSVLQRIPAVPVPAVRVLIALVALLLTAWPQWQAGGPHTQLVDEWLRDQLIRVQASDAAEERIAVIDIDESSLAKAGPWPWPRERLATLVEQLLGEYGARAVALDLVLP